MAAVPYKTFSSVLAACASIGTAAPETRTAAANIAVTIFSDDA